MDKHDIVCFCNHVSVGDIWTAIDAHDLKSTNDVMESTYAATRCGGCYDKVITVTEEYLELKNTQG